MNKIMTRTVCLVFISILAVLLATTAEAQRGGRRSVVTPELDPLNAEIDFIVSQMLLRGNLVLAENSLRGTLLRHPDSARATMLLGVCLQKEKRYSAAREVLKSALEMKGEFKERRHTWHYLGWANYYLGNLSEARSAFEEHLKVVPEEGDSIFGLGVISLDEGKLDEAESRFIEAIRLQKDNPRRQADVAKAHARLGQTYEQRDQLEKAEEHLRISTTMNGDLYDAWFMLERVLRQRERDADADQAHAQGLAARERVRPQVTEIQTGAGAPAASQPEKPASVPDSVEPDEEPGTAESKEGR